METWQLQGVWMIRETNPTEEFCPLGRGLWILRLEKGLSRRPYLNACAHLHTFKFGDRGGLGTWD